MKSTFTVLDLTTLMGFSRDIVRYGVLDLLFKMEYRFGNYFGNYLGPNELKELTNLILQNNRKRIILRAPANFAENTRQISNFMFQHGHTGNYEMLDASISVDIFLDRAKQILNKHEK